MNTNGNKPDLYLIALFKYINLRIKIKILNSRLLNLVLKILEKMVFNKPAKILKGNNKFQNISTNLIVHSASQVANFEEFDSHSIPNKLNTVEVFALYLPQFHPLEINEKHWGEGFTEWTNVTQSKPLFEGHVQPVIPGKFGFYDLRNPEVIRSQIKLAKSAGISGFLIFIYWFDNFALMDEPLQNIKEICEEENFKFAFEWANEPWTKKWDGLESQSEIIIHQSKILSLDSIEMFMAKYKIFFESKSYLSFKNKPVLFIYNPGYFEEKSVELIRKSFQKFYNKNLFLVGMQTFDATHKSIIDSGYDESSEYFPHNINSEEFDQLVNRKTYSSTIDVTIHDYEICTNKIISSTKRNGIPNCFPSWDNSPRRRNSGANIFVNCTSKNFETWFENTIERAAIRGKNDQLNLALINAWNEWAEGAVLEPSRISGYAYINSVKRVMSRLTEND